MKTKWYNLGSVGNAILVEIDEYNNIYSIEIEEDGCMFNGMRLLEILPHNIQELIHRELAQISLSQI